MKNAFIVNDAKWIWIDRDNLADAYADFEFNVDYRGKNAVLELSCDGNFAVYANGELAGFGQYPDFPHYKILEKVDLTDYLKDGNNKITITVWRQGVPSSTYYVADSGLLFRVSIDGKTALASDENVLCRYNTKYLNGYQKYITPQLGLSYLYDATANEGEFKNAVEVSKSYEFFDRPIEKLNLGERLNGVRLGDGIIDLGREYVGFLDLEFNSPVEQKITISFSEHLTDSDVARHVGIRDFSVEYVAKKGKNSYLNPFLRLGCKYLKFDCKTPIDLLYLGLREVTYPLREKTYDFLPNEYGEIYRACVNTLKLCAHDHYEDNPWREQSMYVLDSRNQMLSGYYAFEGYDYQRAGLVLIAKSQMDNGLLSITAPNSRTMAIPSFSLVYPIAVCEYVEHSKDLSVLDEVYGVCEKIIGTFKNSMDETGLIPHFARPCWNFYEWSKDSEGYFRENPDSEINVNPHYDLLANTMFLYSLSHFKRLAELRGQTVDFDEATFKSKIKEYFKKGDKYVLSDFSKESSVLGNSLVALTDIEDDSGFLIKQIKSGKLIDITLSMTTFLYEALLKVDKNDKDYILNDIKEKYGYMLSTGCQTCWETILGAEDFDGAGSLCHGWSALPIYYLNKFFR